MNISKNVLEISFDDFPSFDLVYCVDLTFQFLDPIVTGSGPRMLKLIYSLLSAGRKLVMGLDCRHRLLEK